MNVSAPPRLRRNSGVVSKRQRTTLAAKSRPRTTFRVPRPVGAVTVGFPKAMQIRHRFVYTGTTAGTPVSVFQFTVNGLAQPTSLSPAHQPMYFDQMAALYNNYTVMNSKITIQWDQATGPDLFGVYIEDDLTISPLTATACAEQSTANYRYVGTGVTNSPQTLVKWWNAKQNYGGDIRDNDDLSGSGTANPAQIQYFTLFAGAARKFTATVEYTAIWDKLQAIPAS